LFLLVLDEEEGEIPKSVEEKLDALLAGAILTDLALFERIMLIDGRVVVRDQTLTEDELLDKTLFNILDTRRPRKLRYWINTIIYEKITIEVGHDLVMKGVLKRKKKQLHLAASEGGDTFRSHLISNLRRIVLENQEPKLREKVLLTLLYNGDLLRLIFSHKERKTARKRAKKLISIDGEGNNLGTPFDEIVAATANFIR
jgi:hypothetical protein